jgi:hypothetical protein
MLTCRNRAAAPREVDGLNDDSARHRGGPARPSCCGRILPARCRASRRSRRTRDAVAAPALLAPAAIARKTRLRAAACDHSGPAWGRKHAPVKALCSRNVGRRVVPEVGVEPTRPVKVTGF